jgi:anti-anti-sigma factor
VHRVSVQTIGEAAVLRGEGELDAFVEPDLQAALAELGRRRQVVVHLEAVSFMDSTALGAIVRGIRELGEAGSEVRVVLPRGSARRIFEITTLDRVLPLGESLDDALADLAR